MPVTRKQQLGRWGEEMAARFLEGKGFSILGRNVRTPYGEIDLIAGKAERISFVEVKTRKSTAYGYPEAGVTAKKLEHMLAAAQFFIEDHPEWVNKSWQIDVIAVQEKGKRGMTGKGDGVEIEYFENITG